MGIIAQSSSDWIKIWSNWWKWIQRFRHSKIQGCQCAGGLIEKIEDKTVLATKSAKEKELSTLINERKQLKKEKDVNNEAKIDSLNKLIAQRTRFWEEKINTATDIHLQNIQKKYLENISLYIDDARVELNQCFYYTHPHFKEQGLKCFFDTDTLSTGIHFVKFIRNVVEKDDEIEKDSLILPINKH